MIRLRGHIGTAALLGAVSVTMLVGCSSNDQDSAEHEAAACAALTNLDSVLATASNELADVQTVGELRTVRENVRSAYEEADSALDRVAEDRAESLQQAWNTFRDETSSVDDDTELTDARDSLLEEARALAVARSQAQSGLSCD